MTWITAPSSPISAPAPDGPRQSPSLTYAGGISITSADGVDGSPHIVVEAPPAPIAWALIDLSVTTEQAIAVTAQGRYIVDQVVVYGLSRESLTSATPADPDGVTLTLRTLDAARGGGRVLANALDLSGLSDPKAIAQAAPDLGVWQEAPWLYATIASPGEGRAILAVFGRLLSLDDPYARTYDKRRLG